MCSPFWFLLASLMSLGCEGMGTGSDSDSVPVIRVVSEVRHQTISGWEAHSQSGQDLPTFPLFRDTLFDLAVDDLGINRIRLEVWAGAEDRRDWWADYRAGRIDDATWKCHRFATVNDNGDPRTIDWTGFHFSKLDHEVESVVLPLKQRLEARGERLYINLMYDAFTRQICGGLAYNHTDPEEYAEFIVAASIHLRTKYGLVPDAWEAILEPDNSPQWSNGTVIGRAIVAAGARLEAAGFTPRFIAPSNTNMANAITYFDELSKVPNAMRYVRELAYHRYSGVSNANLATIAARAEQHGIETSMLEHIGSGHEALHADLTIGNVSAWQQFTLAFPTSDNGAQYFLIDQSDPTKPTVVLASRSRYLRQYFRYVRRGAVRVEATTTTDAFDPVAFVNANGRHVVVVKAARAGTFEIRGLPAGRYGVTYTIAQRADLAGADMPLANGQPLMATIPGTGVLTVFQKP